MDPYDQNQAISAVGSATKRVADDIAEPPAMRRFEKTTEHALQSIALSLSFIAHVLHEETKVGGYFRR